MICHESPSMGTQRLAREADPGSAGSGKRSRRQRPQRSTAVCAGARRHPSSMPAAVEVQVAALRHPISIAAAAGVQVGALRRPSSMAAVLEVQVAALRRLSSMASEVPVAAQRTTIEPCMSRSNLHAVRLLRLVQRRRRVQHHRRTAGLGVAPELRQGPLHALATGPPLLAWHPDSDLARAGSLRGQTMTTVRRCERSLLRPLIAKAAAFPEFISRSSKPAPDGNVVSKAGQEALFCMAFFA